MNDSHSLRSYNEQQDREAAYERWRQRWNRFGPPPASADVAAKEDCERTLDEYSETGDRK